MNKTPFDKSQNSEDELLPEYYFDYKTAKPNRFANRNDKQHLTVVVLFVVRTKVLTANKLILYFINIAQPQFKF
ncbi:MAG TPA: hypothetical protein V6D15_13375 [Oculatellaceae cyanobacterium]|jgi:hypothetical protein